MAAAVVTVGSFMHGAGTSGRSSAIAFVLGSLGVLSLTLVAVGMIVERRRRR